MRRYPLDSPRAAARIVAFTMLCDGHLAPAEVAAFERHEASRRLGLVPGQWQEVMTELCEDLLSGADLCWQASCRVDPHALAGLLAEVADPALRRDVLQLCLAVVDADAHVDDGEALVMNAAVEQWGLQHEMFKPAHESRLCAPA
jgi:uncharacterized tellurite resistance protein B-like protein